MARRRFFVPEIRCGLAELTGDDAEHLVRVLRVEAGQRFEISDNQRVYLAEVETARKSLVSFVIQEELPVVPTPAMLHLFVALFKFDHFEWLIEKATELGVAGIQPIDAARTEHGLERAAVKRSARWEKIALEASQQARRARLPSIGPVLPFDKAIGTGKGFTLLLDEEPGAPPILQTASSFRKENSILLGPEGGWTNDERSAAQAAGWKPCSLGPTVLRAETAGIAALAILGAAAHSSSS